MNANDIWSRIGGEEVQAAEFWKPGTEGETLLGKVDAFASGTVGGDTTRRVELSHVVVFGGASDKAKGYASLNVGLNSVLKTRLREGEHEGAYVAIQYTGSQPTPKGGTPMRVYRVSVLDRARFVELVEKLTPDHPALAELRKPARAGNGDGVDLPF